MRRNERAKGGRRVGIEIEQEVEGNRKERKEKGKEREVKHSNTENYTSMTQTSAIRTVVMTVINNGNTSL